MNNLKDVFRIGLIVFVIGFFLVPLGFRKTVNKIPLSH